MDLALSNFIIVTFIVIFGLTLSLWVFIANKKMASNQLLALLILVAMTNLSFSYFMNFSDITSVALVCGKLAWATVSVGVVLFYCFIAYFPKKEKTNFPFDRLIILIIGGILAVLSVFTSYIIKDTIFNKGAANVVSGSLMNVYYSVIVGILLISFYTLFKKYLNAAKIDKTKIQFFLIGLFIFVCISITFNALLPVVFGIEDYTYIGDYSIVFFFGFTAYAIVKHRLMDIKMVVARSVAYTLLLVTLAGGYALAIFGVQSLVFHNNDYSNVQIAVQVVLAIIMAFTFQPLRRFLTKSTDRIFFKNEYNFEDLLKELTTNANATLILIELLYKTLDILIKNMKVTRGIFILLDDHGDVFTSQSLQYSTTPKFTNEDIVKLSKHESVVFDELEEGSSLKKLLRRFDASLVLSLRSDEGKPTGVLILGEKESGDMYSAKDIDLFGILMPELSTAIHRAREHEKVQQFNVTLQAEVARKTKELQVANDHLQELDKAKDEFISMASHQLRTPLTAIKGYLSMLLEGDAGEIKMAQYDFVNEAFNAASRMVGLINDLLNVSRMETGRFFLEPVKVDMEILTREEIKQIQNHADEKKLFVKLEIKNKKLPKITADETKIRQVVMNFVDNAIYYTQKGGVTVSLDADKKNFIFKVTDTGIGVPEAQKRNLFEKFYRADNARRTRPDGTGLGIYLAKRVIEDHGGTITFDSVEGKGSTFGFLFPLKSKIKKELTIAPPDLAVAVQTSHPESLAEAPKVEAPPAKVEKKEDVKEVPEEEVEEITKGSSALF